jgi:hypothetical protein
MPTLPREEQHSAALVRAIEREEQRKTEAARVRDNVVNFGDLRPQTIRGVAVPSGRFLPGEETEREKSTRYLTVFGQNRHGVS